MHESSVRPQLLGDLHDELQFVGHVLVRDIVAERVRRKTALRRDTYLVQSLLACTRLNAGSDDRHGGFDALLQLLRVLELRELAGH